MHIWPSFDKMHFHNQGLVLNHDMLPWIQHGNPSHLHIHQQLKDLGFPKL
jgi:hypothetical protein